MIVGNFEYIVGGLLAEFDDICREILSQRILAEFEKEFLDFYS